MEIDRNLKQSEGIDPIHTKRYLGMRVVMKILGLPMMMTSAGELPDFSNPEVKLLDKDISRGLYDKLFKKMIK